MRTTKLSVYSVFAFLAILIVSIPQASAATVFGADASVWDSTVPIDSVTGIYPIGGSGQINGEFAIETVEDTNANTAIQIGLRAQERFVGPTLPRMEAMYFADEGESEPGLATWNYDWHIDFGTTYLDDELGNPGLTPQNMRDFDVFFEVDTDPSFATSFVSTDINAAATLAGVPAGSPILLSQTSQNIGFGVFGGPLDPTIPGVYNFRLTVSDPTDSSIVAQVEIQVKVGEFVIGGEIIPLQTTSLLLAGIQTSMAWILPVVVAGAGFAAYKLRRI